MAVTAIGVRTPALPRDVLAAYDAAAPALVALADALRARVAAWLAEAPGLKLHSVTMRVKDRASLEAKLARPDRTYAALEDVTDLIGLRVITYFEDAVDEVGALLEPRLSVDVHHSVDKRRLHDDARFGYRSLHYVCRAPAPDLGGLPPGLRFEIQVRTVLAHAWAEIEHDLGYKAADAVPAATRRRLARIAGLLELADEEFVAIRRELADYARALPARIARADDIALDRLSLAALLEQGELLALDRAIALRLGRPLGDRPFFPDYLVRLLRAVGIETVAEAREAVVDADAAILAMVEPYFAFTARAWRLTPERLGDVPRGYALLFLAHVRALDGARGGGVARLAAVYEAVDYPGEPARALEVARGIAAARAAAQLADDATG